MTKQDRTNLVHNIVEAMKGIEGEKKNQIIDRQLHHFSRVDTDLEEAIAKGLGNEIA